MIDFESIITAGAETKELDYKGPREWSERDKQSCCELIKDILAMANTKGGHLVIGVSEAASGFTLDGLTQEQMIAQAIHCLTKLYEGKVQDQEMITFRLRLIDLLNRWLWVSSSPT